MTKPIKSILISGASKGIGEACALHFSRQGYRVFAGIRNSEDGNRLQQQAGESLIPVRLDVTQQDEIKALKKQIAQVVGEEGLFGLVNNAGIGVPGPMEFLPLDDIRYQFEVNYFGQVAVTQAVLPMLRQARGRIINISSISGRFVYPFFGPYAASKFALEAFSDALRRELIPWGIRVASVEPGNIVTPIWETTITNSNQRIADFPAEADVLYGRVLAKVLESAVAAGKRGLPPQAVVRVVEHALTARRPKTRYVVGLSPRLTILLARFLPDSLMDWFVKRALYT